MWFNIPLYVTILILIVLTLFLIVRENFIGFDEHRPPLDHEDPNYTHLGAQQRHCVGCN